MERINITLDKLGDLGDSQLGTTLFVPLPSSAFLHLPRCESLRQGYTRVSGAYYHRWTHLTVVLAQGCSTQQPQPEEYCCADFLGSSQGMWPLVERIVRHSSGISPHVPAAPVMAANCPDWVNLDNMDIPIICQRTLSVTIDEAIYSHLLFNAPDTHSRTRGLSFSSSIAHTGDWLNVVPLAPIMIMTQKFCYVRNNEEPN